MVPEDCLRVERWQGPPHINKVKQFESLLPSKISLFIQSDNEECFYLVSLAFKKKSQCMKIFLC